MIFGKADKNDIEQLINLRIAYLSEDFNGLNNEQISSLSSKLSEYYSEHPEKDLFVYTARDNKEIVSCCFPLITKNRLIRHF